MRFTELLLPGAFLIELEPAVDERGYFARTFCTNEFGKHGLHTDFPQSNVSRNTKVHTLRGMHFQRAPYEEIKLVRCIRGGILDVLVDIRQGSPTRGKWVSAELTAENGKALYVPTGLAHGFITLQPDTDVLYQMGIHYVGGYADGVRWDDPAFGITWPANAPILSERDAKYPDWRP